MPMDRNSSLLLREGKAGCFTGKGILTIPVVSDVRYRLGGTYSGIKYGTAR